LFENNSFESNFAPYGPDISSYPSNILTEIPVLNIPSGQSIKEKILVSLRDPEDQVVTNSQSVVKIVPHDSSNLVLQ